MSYDRDVEQATSSADGSNDWEKIISFCNRVRDSIGSTAMQLAITAIFKRIKSSSEYRAQLQAITLLESCAGNCGKLFQVELANQQSLLEIRSIITGSQYNGQVVARMKEVLASWTTEFQNDTAFAPIRQLYDKLRREGISFVQQASSSSTVSSSGQQQQSSAGSSEDDVARAIRLSLEEANKLKSPSSGSALYPSLSTQPTKSPTSSSTVSSGGGRKVRAIYDFDAAEDNELTFKAGEIVELLDDSDQNWWKGRTALGTGLFPANFVSKNINKDPEPVTRTTATANQQQKKKDKVVAVSLEKIGLCLEMLKSADATDANQGESETTKELEEECQQMRPLVEKKIKEMNSQEEEMDAVSKIFHEAIATYKKLLMETSAKPTASTQQPPQALPGNSSSGYTTQPVANGNQYLSYAPPSVYGAQTGELPPMMTRLSPELSRAHGGALQQQTPIYQPQYTGPVLPPQPNVYQVPPPVQGYAVSTDRTSYQPPQIFSAPLPSNYSAPPPSFTAPPPGLSAPPPYQPLPQNMYTTNTAPLF